MINNWLRLLGTTGLLLGPLWAGCDRGHAAEADASNGYQGIVEHEERALGFELGGRLLELTVQEGTALTPGQTIAKLDESLERIGREARATDLQAAQAQLALVESGARVEEVRAASAELRAARSSVDLLERNLNRQRTLEAQGASTSVRTDELLSQLDQARARVDALSQRERALRSGARDQEIELARTRVTAAEAGLRASDERLARYTLTTQHAGTVLHTHVEPGEVVAPGAPVATIADLDHPYVDVFVPQSEISRIQLGQVAEVRVDTDSTTLSGKVENISSRTEFTPRFVFSERERPNLVVRVRIRLDDPSHKLRAGIPAFARMVAAR